MNDEYEEPIEELDYARDPVTGRKSKKPTMAVLNKREVSSWEMDELFCEEEA